MYIYIHIHIYIYICIYVYYIHTHMYIYREIELKRAFPPFEISNGEDTHRQRERERDTHTHTQAHTGTHTRTTRTNTQTLTIQRCSTGYRWGKWEWHAWLIDRWVLGTQTFSVPTSSQRTLISGWARSAYCSRYGLRLKGVSGYWRLRPKHVLVKHSLHAFHTGPTLTFASSQTLNTSPSALRRHTAQLPWNDRTPSGIRKRILHEFTAFWFKADSCLRVTCFVHSPSNLYTQATHAIHPWCIHKTQLNCQQTLAGENRFYKPIKDLLFKPSSSCSTSQQGIRDGCQP